MATPPSVLFVRSTSASRSFHRSTYLPSRFMTSCRNQFIPQHTNPPESDKDEFFCGWTPRKTHHGSCKRGQIQPKTELCPLPTETALHSAQITQADKHCRGSYWLWIGSLFSFVAHHYLRLFASLCGIYHARCRCVNHSPDALPAVHCHNGRFTAREGFA